MMHDKTPPRVLVVDDDPLIVETLQGIFAEAGLANDGAAGGQEALVKLAAGSYDAVVLDAVMPDLSGPEILRQLQKSTSECPAIVYFTAYPDISAYDTYLGGADAVLIKPRPSEELVDTVRYLADKRRRRLLAAQTIETQKCQIEQLSRRGATAERTSRICHDLKKTLAETSGLTYSVRTDIKQLITPEKKEPVFAADLQATLTKLDKILASLKRLSEQVDQISEH
jgi:DNA-binding response OmpR family regulator